MFSYAEDVINAKLDIIYYIKSILSLDIIKKISLEDKKEMLSFLCMPFISSNIKENMSYYDYHKNFSDEDLENLEAEIDYIVGKEQISEEENNLLYLINQRLKKYKTDN